MTAQQVSWNGSHITVNQSSGYDGDGRRVYDVSSGVTTYYLATSVLRGAIVEEINSSGQKNVGYVYTPGGGLLAQQSLGYPSYQVTWKHSLPAGTGQYQTYSNSSGFGRTELDPVGANVQLYQPPDPPPAEGDGDIGAGHLGGIMSARWSDFFNTSSGCSAAGVLASCSGSIAHTNMDAEARAFFGARWYDLPGNANDRAQGEERYESIMYSGYDPAFSRYWGTFTLTFSNGAVRTLKNPTLDELAKAQTEFLPDSGSSDQDEHDVTTAYNVNIYGGAAYFATPQKTPCTFNVNITGVSGQALTDMRNEISRIFQSGGLGVVFDHPESANGGSMNLAVVARFSGAEANLITSQGISLNNSAVLGATVPGSRNATVNSSNIFRRNPNPYGSHSASTGTQYGRVGAHEVIQHGFLGIPPDGGIQDITRPAPMMASLGGLSAPQTSRFNISAPTAAALGRLCPP